MLTLNDIMWHRHWILSLNFLTIAGNSHNVYICCSLWGIFSCFCVKDLGKKELVPQVPQKTWGTEEELLKVIIRSQSFHPCLFSIFATIFLMSLLPPLGLCSSVFNIFLIKKTLRYIFCLIKISLINSKHVIE